MAGVNVTIGADSRKASKELKTFETKTKSIAKSIAKGFKERIGHKLFDGLAGAARRIPGLLMDAVGAASDLNEELSKSQVIFGGASKEIEAWSKGAAEAMGLSSTAAMQAAGNFGGMFKIMGMTQEEAAKTGMSMAELAADLGSFNNATTEDAVMALGAALRGEAEPIRRFNVLLNDATLKAKALEIGLYNGTGALDPASKAMAAYRVILDQTKDAQGDFKATSDGLANSQKIVKAKLEDASTTVGKSLLPAMQSLVDLLKEADFDAIAKDIGKIASAFVGVGSSVNKAYKGIKWFLEDLQGGKSRLIMPTIFDIGAGVIEPGKTKTKEVKAKVDKVGEEESQRLAGVSFWYQDALNIITSIVDQQTKKNQLLEAEGLILKRNVEAGERLSNLRNQEKEERAEANQSKLSDLEFQMGSLAGQSSNLAVSSMQRIGGGGGSYGQLDLQKRQADLQSKIVDILTAMKADAPVRSVSQL